MHLRITTLPAITASVPSAVPAARDVPRPAQRQGTVNPVAELAAQLRGVVNLLLADRSMLVAMSYLSLGGTLTLIVAMLAPRYVVEVLGIAASDAVFVLAPAGLGMLTAAFF